MHFRLSGLLQFSVGQPPMDGDEIILPATVAPHVKVQEEAGHVRLLVVRAQGLLGMVLVQYRTISLTALSPQDYQVGIAEEKYVNQLYVSAFSVST